jgi:spore coat protein CotF
MPFGAHETMEVHEVLNEKINLINHFTLYAGMTQDPELRDMIERHLRTAIHNYEQLVAYTHDYAAANQRADTYGRPRAEPRDIRYGLDNPGQLGPEMPGRLGEPQIAMAMLQCHKSSAKNHMQGSLECADPNVRDMLLNGAFVCANQAYEVFLYMNRRGQYQVPTMQDHTAKSFLHAYQPMSEMVY